MKEQRHKMENRTIKNPQQQRSIDKKNKIIESGMTLMMHQGYHNTTTDDIAKAAGVSTGIVYRYFYDKKDIFMAGLSLYFVRIKEHFLSVDISMDDIHTFLKNVLDEFILLHQEYYDIHEEIESLRHSDTDIKELYQSFLQQTIDEIIEKFPDEMKDEYFREKIYLSLEIMEGFCHFTMHHHDHIDIAYMKDTVITSVERIIHPSSNNK